MNVLQLFIVGVTVLGPPKKGVLTQHCAINLNIQIGGNNSACKGKAMILRVHITIHVFYGSDA